MAIFLFIYGSALKPIFSIYMVISKVLEVQTSLVF